MERSSSARRSSASNSRPCALLWVSASISRVSPRQGRLLDQRRHLALALPVALVLAPACGIAVHAELAAQPIRELVPVAAQPFLQVGPDIVEDVAPALPVCRIVRRASAAQGLRRHVRQWLAGTAVADRQRQGPHPAVERLAQLVHPELLDAQQDDGSAPSGT